MSTGRTFPYVVYSTRDGDLGERRTLRAIDYRGRPVDRKELIPLPDGTSLSMLPQRLAVGVDERGTSCTVAGERGWALAALLPIGYTRTRLPGYATTPETKPLPFF